MCEMVSFYFLVIFLMFHQPWINSHSIDIFICFIEFPGIGLVSCRCTGLHQPSALLEFWNLMLLPSNYGSCLWLLCSPMLSLAYLLFKHAMNLSLTFGSTYLNFRTLICHVTICCFLFTILSVTQGLYGLILNPMLFSSFLISWNIR